MPKAKDRCFSGTHLEANTRWQDEGSHSCYCKMAHKTVTLDFSVRIRSVSFSLVQRKFHSVRVLTESTIHKCCYAE